MKLHVRLEGKSFQMPLAETGISENMSDNDIKKVVANIYEISPSKLPNVVIDRNPDGIVVRPPAIFG